MANNEKNMTTGNENSIDEKKEQQGTPDSPADNKDEKKDGVFKKIGNGFKKHGKKIGIGLGLAAAFAGGLAAEKFGLPAFGKKDPDQPEEQ
jgi:hypothetical protein